MSGRARRGNNNPQGGGDGGGGEPAAAAAVPPQGEEPNYAKLILAALTATNNVLASLGTALQNLPNGMAAALPAPPLPPPPPTAAVTGVAAPPTAAVRSPFRAAGAAVLDFHTKDGKKFYDPATRALFSSNELFDVEPEQFQLFLSQRLGRQPVQRL
ncbi:hypothetical protein ACA910_021807 [Epithemia clementina (nom. ined.)]